MQRKLFGFLILSFFAVLVVAQTRTGGGSANSLSAFTQFCGTASTCSHASLITPQIVFGSAPLVTGTPSTVTISGITPAFTSATSYKCVVNDQSAPTSNLVSVTSYVSGSSFTITGPATNTDVIAYICTGN
jgi:hypothetical protein